MSDPEARTRSLRKAVATPKRLVAVVGMALVVGYGFGRCSGSDDAPDTVRAPAASSEHAGHGAVETAPEIWTCSMHPQIQLPKPGKCPICGMDLIPVPSSAAGGAGDDMPNLRRLTMSEAAVGLAKIQTAVVARGFASKEVRMVGKVTYDETRERTIAAWVPGRIDRLYVDYTGIEVEEGDHLVYLYSPELLTAQEELIQTVRAAGELTRSGIASLRESADATAEAAREKLRLLGLTAGQVREIERRGSPTDHITIYSPIGGTVLHKNAVEGAYVQTGTPIYRIADLSRVWVLLDAYESDMTWIRYGQDVAFVTEAYPGEEFHGTIAFIDPVLDPMTRTVKVRVNVDNPDGRLKPEMFVRAVVRAGVAAGGKVMDPALSGKWISPMHPEVVRDAPGPCPVCGMALVRAEDLGFVAATPETAPLLIPASAPLITGERAIVYVKVLRAETPTFEGREIVLGPRAGEHYVVRAGLEAGEEVVVKGNFNIDSALQIQARPAMMSTEGGAGGGAGHDHGGPKKPAPTEVATETMQAPAAFRNSLAPIYDRYAQIHASLAGDDLGGARAAYGDLSAVLDDVDMSQVEGHSHMVWMDVAGQLSNSAALGVDAETIEAARKAFGTLSEEMIRLAKKLGLPEQEAMSQAYCPMAFGGEGARWLQSGETIENPYFGAAMLRCGELQERFGSDRAHEGH